MTLDKVLLLFKKSTVLYRTSDRVICNYLNRSIEFERISLRRRMSFKTIIEKMLFLWLNFVYIFDIYKVQGISFPTKKNEENRTQFSTTHYVT